MSGLPQNRGCAGSIDSRIYFLNVEVSAGSPQKILWVEGRKSMNDPVRRKNDEAGAIHIYERHHDELVGGVFLLDGADHDTPCAFARCPNRLGGEGSAFVSIVQGSLIAVVAVGDDELLVAHLTPNQINEGGIRDPPHAVQDAKFIGEFRRRSGILREQGVDLARI